MNRRWTLVAFDVSSDTRRRRLDRHLQMGFTAVQRSVRVSSPLRAAAAELVLCTLPELEAGDRFVVVRSCVSCSRQVVRVEANRVAAGFVDPVISVIAEAEGSSGRSGSGPFDGPCTGPAGRRR